MSGLGAWSAELLGPTRAYHFGMDVPDDRVRRGIFAFKQELIYKGLGRGIVLDLPIFGNSIRDRTAEFQRSCNLMPTGTIGPRTARYLFWTRANRCALTAGIPNRLVARIVTLESANDPVAEGFVDADDEGGAQIHLPFYPEISIEQAHDPSFYYPWVAGRLVAAAEYCDDDYDGAVAAHNIGWFYARAWVRDGKPASGGPPIGEADSYARATNYVALVKRQPIFG